MIGFIIMEENMETELNNLKDEFEPLKFADIYAYVKTIDVATKDLVLAEHLLEIQRRMRKSPQQIVGQIEERKKELLKKV